MDQIAFPGTPAEPFRPTGSAPHAGASKEELPTATDLIAAMRAQLDGSGRFPADVNRTYAALIQSFYTTLGHEMGLSTLEVQERYPLKLLASAASRPTVRPLPSPAFLLGDLPRDMREELFNEYATGVNPEATEAEFCAMRVPCGLIDIADLQVSHYPPAQLQRYQVTDPSTLPPLVISDRRLVDGGHRISSERAAGGGQLRYIDMTSLIDTSSTGYISELPSGHVLHANTVLNQPAYHGTAYAGIERFSTEKIGTGEGNQTYGWGLYFAGRKEVGEHYRKMLAPAVFVGPAGTMSAQTVVSGMAAAMPLSPADKNDIFGSLLDMTRGDRSFTDFASTAEAYWVLGRNSVCDAFRWANENGYSALPAGQLYEVDLPSDESMLSWDGLMCAQPPSVRTAISGLFTEDQLAFVDIADRLEALRLSSGTKGQAYSDLYDEFELLQSKVGNSFHERFGTWGAPTGSAIYASVSKVMGGEKKASAFLAELGIKGIKYADGLSRGQDEPASHNYVVFSGDDVAVRSTFYQASVTAPETPVSGLAAWLKSSVVIDHATGAPLVLYHGTSVDFASFDTAKLGSSSDHSTAKAGHFFTADPRVAASFAGVRWDGWPLTESFSPGANIMPVYLSVAAPVRITAKQFLTHFVRGQEDFAKFAKVSEALGHDGILIAGDQELAESMGGEEYGADSWVVFHPEQIKSAIGNQGAFDASNANILMQGPARSHSADTTTAQIEQPAGTSFNEWFDGSKVVDKQHKPLQVYHGTAGDFSEFRKTAGGEFGPAIYFTDSAREAGEYGDGQRGMLGTSVMPVFLSIRNPYTKGVEAFWDEFGGSDEDVIAVERAAAAGYDGIISPRPDRYYDNTARAFVDRGGVLTHYIAFRPEQIKSAIGNQGSFEASSANILHQDPVPTAATGASDPALANAQYARQWEDHSSQGESADDFDWVRRHLTHEELLLAVGGAEALERELAKPAAQRNIDPHRSDLTVPVVLAYEPWSGSGGTLWDGVHRAMSALLLGETIEGVVGTPTTAYLEREDAGFALSGLPTLASRRRDAFLAWFEGSAMVDDGGQPIELYHGTDQDFDTFDPSKSSPGAAFGPGIYLSEDRENTNWKRGEGNNVMPLFASIKNPLDIRTTLTASEATKLQAIGLASAVEGAPAPLLTMERRFGSIAAATKAAGFDGLLHFGPAGKRHVLAFEASQVKSAIGNRGTFSAESGNVLHQRATQKAATSTTASGFPEGWTGWSTSAGKAMPSPMTPRLPKLPKPSTPADGLTSTVGMTRTEPVPSPQASLLAPLTSSRKFKQWFRSSKAVDEATGTPLTLFHGTAVDGTTFDTPKGQLPKGAFTEFKKSMLGSVSESSDAKVGFWFSASEDRAWDAARDAIAGEWGSSAYVYEVHLSLQNPLVLEDIKEYNPSEVAKIARKAGREGHDGLIFTAGEAGPADYLVFDPRQIKSAHANQGTFDATDRNILKQDQGDEPVPNATTGNRGQISFADDITQQPSVISLLEDADLSTLPHETGHFFLEVYSDLASRPDAPATVKADMEMLLDWFGIKGEEPSPETEIGAHDGDQLAAFTRWFGSSKVVDGDRAPLLVYHATSRDFDVFDQKHSREGFHFGTSAQASSRATGPGKIIMPVHLAITNPRRSRDTGGGWAAKMRSASSSGHDGIVYLNRHEGIPYEAFERAAEALAARRGGETTFDRLDRLTDTEFKALIPEAADSYIAFKPEQIKSAVGNRGSFDVTSANILHQPAPGTVGDSEDQFNRALIDQQLHSEDPVAFFEAKLSAAEDHLFALTSYEATPSYNGTPTRFWSPEGKEYAFDELPPEVRAAAEPYFKADEAWAAGEAGYEPEFFSVDPNHDGTNDSASDNTLFQSAFHGTPHRGIATFDVARIGSGEGNQTFGWGLYFASQQAVAEHYKNSDRAKWRLDGKHVSGDWHRRAEAWPGAREAFTQTLTILSNHTSVAEARKEIEESVAENRASSKAGVAARERLHVFEGILPRLRPIDGQVYQVDIPDDEHMLLWDLPFSKQPAAVRDAIEEVALAFRRGESTSAEAEAIDKLLKEVDDYPSLTGSNLYEGLSLALGIPSKSSYQVEPNPRNASQALAAIGIKGIKYLDGSSRAGHIGTSNYVIFSHADVAVTSVLYQERAGADGTMLDSGRGPVPGLIALPKLPQEGARLREALLGAPLRATTKGRSPLEVWRSMSLVQKRPFHEQFARGFEAYLMEGRSPTPALQGLFGRFKTWLTDVYKSLAALDVKLTDNVRGVMGRMLNREINLHRPKKSDDGWAADQDPGEREAVQRLAARCKATTETSEEATQIVVMGAAASEDIDEPERYRSDRQR